jgi:hypothetical protein
VITFFLFFLKKNKKKMDVDVDTITRNTLCELSNICRNAIAISNTNIYYPPSNKNKNETVALTKAAQYLVDEKGISNISHIYGSGPNNVVCQSDVENYLTTYILAHGDRRENDTNRYIVVFVWNLNNGQVSFLKNLVVETFDVDESVLAISPQNVFVAVGSMTGDILLLNIQTGEIITKFLHPQRTQLRKILFSPNGLHLITAYKDGLIRICDLKTFSCVGEYQTNQTLTCICLSFDGQILVTGDYTHTIKVWVVDSFECICNFVSMSRYNEAISSVFINKDKTEIISTTTYGPLCIWDIQSKSLKRTCFEWWFLVFKYQYRMCAISDDGRFALTYSSTDNVFFLLNIETQERIREFGSAKYIGSLEYHSPTCSFIYTSFIYRNAHTHIGQITI